MRAGRLLAAMLCVVSTFGLAACFATRQQPSAPDTQPAVPAPVAPSAAGTVPDVVPRVEPRSRSGNPPFYNVLGKRYYVMSSSVGYVERGVASWYGPGFHKIRTSTGEPYDMYGMTAAHKTLPLPAFVQVTNLQNGRSVIVRVNDRGPFVGNRIIDLSYTAASKLDMLRNGTALVEVRSIDPAAAAAATTASTVNAVAPAEVPAAAPVSTFYIQAGAFSDPNNAEHLAQRLRGGGYGSVFVRDSDIGGRRMFRVRIGPVSGVAEFDRIVAALERAGISDAHLALD